jgi:hypothetical protein
MVELLVHGSIKIVDQYPEDPLISYFVKKEIFV